MSHDTPRAVAPLSGDPDALARLLEEHLPLVHAIASRALGHHADAEDVAQETMVRAVAPLPELRDPARFRPWIVAITMRQLRDRSRRAQRRGIEVSLDALHSPGPGDGRGLPAAALVATADVADLVATQLDGAAHRAVMDRAVDWLDPEERQVLALLQLELEGAITRDDLAAGLDVSRPHAAVRVHRLRVRLAEARQIVAALAASERPGGCGPMLRLTRGWDGEPTALWRKRLHRHVRGCAACAAASSDIPG